MTAFARYFAVGGSAFLLHLAVLQGLLAVGACAPWLASAIGFVVACLFNYAAQHRWVFRSSRSHQQAAPIYIGITTVMLGVNTVLFQLLHGTLGLPPALAQTGATGAVFVANFFLNRSLTFAQRRLHADGGS